MFPCQSLQRSGRGTAASPRCWHDSRPLCVPANLTLVPLPPYSPELNPVERIWLCLKERFLSHRLHVEAPHAEAGRIESLCTYPWIPKVKTKDRWYDFTHLPLDRLRVFNGGSPWRLLLR